MPRQLFDSLERPGRLAGVQIDADLLGNPVSEAEPSGGQRIGRRADPLGQVQVLDRASQIVSYSSPRRPGNQVQGQPAAELDRVMVIRHIRPIRQGVCFLEPTDPRGFLGVPQDHVPMSQHG